MSQRCRSCGARVVFVPSGRTTSTGMPIWMILDAKPTKRVLLVNQVTGIPVNGPGHQDTVTAAWDTYTPHRDSCPQGEAWHGRRLP